MTRVLVTGATGLVGSALCEVLARSGHCVRAAVRSDGPVVPSCVSEKAVVGDIGRATDWGAALNGVDSVIHLAARAHVLHPTPASADLYVETNARGTLCLANASAQAGVRRLVYLSSVKVNGEVTTSHAYGPDDEPHPQDAYGTSKWLGEKHLLEVAARTGMQAIIVRSPLVYGPGVRANFLRLMRWVDSGWPLPLASIENRRSLVSVWNLSDLLVNLLGNATASAGPWMVSDDEDLSTPELIRRIARAMNRRVRLISVPVGVLQLCAGLVGRGAETSRLCGSLVVDTRQTHSVLGWSAPVSMDTALASTVSWYRSQGLALGS